MFGKALFDSLEWDVVNVNYSEEYGEDSYSLWREDIGTHDVPENEVIILD